MLIYYAASKDVHVVEVSVQRSCCIAPA